jgi:hypothetical protein
LKEAIQCQEDQGKEAIRSKIVFDCQDGVEGKRGRRNQKRIAEQEARDEAERLRLELLRKEELF